MAAGDLLAVESEARSRPVTGRNNNKGERQMHTYVRINADMWEVGCWYGGGWKLIKRFQYEIDAAACVNYLNGGDGKRQ